MQNRVFNALLTNGEYDRKYNANDYCENLAVIINNGVLRSPNDDLKVTADGMVVTVGVGRAWIDGHYYFNDTSYSSRQLQRRQAAHVTTVSFKIE